MLAREQSFGDPDFPFFSTTHGAAGRACVISWESKPVLAPVPQPVVVPRSQGRVTPGRGPSTAGSRGAAPGGRVVPTTFFSLQPLHPTPPHLTSPHLTLRPSHSLVPLFTSRPCFKQLVHLPIFCSS